jgi:defect-in-organelle-trafficking protein DotC
MIEPGLLPPVITEGRDAYNQASDSEARASDRIYRIERAARIVSASPTWRTYLLADPTPALAPNATVMPRNDAERRVWDEFSARGWDAGVAQADSTFKSNLGRLNQDFQGMLRFKMLYEQGLVNMPRLSRQQLGTTGGGQELALGDRIIKISSQALLDANSRNWNTNGRLPATAPYDIDRGAGPDDYPRPTGDH